MKKEKRNRIVNFLKYNEINDNLIINECITIKGRLCTAWISEFPKIQNYLLNRYVDSDKYPEIIYRIKNNIENKPKCPVCGKILKFNGYSYGYNKYCSIECTNRSDEHIKKCIETQQSHMNEIIANRKEKFLKLYGVDNLAKLPSSIEKAKQTCLKRYGSENYSTSEEGIKKLKEISKQTSEKIKQTCLERYGVEYFYQSKVFKEKQKNTVLKKYGSFEYGSSDGMKIKRTYTMLQKYNVKFYSQTDEYKEKQYITKKKNNSFHTSKIEQQFKQYLDNTFENDYIYQYYSNDYPFNCDFYIISLDLYIEIQGTWTHGNHPFDETNIDDIKKVKYWESKNTEYYVNAIKTWTETDVKKRNIAKNNKLNYLEIFSKNINTCIKELNDYLSINNV